MRVKFGFIDLRFPASLSAVIRDEVHVQGFLTPGLNPNVYATGATPEDPARRLSIKLTTENDQGRFRVWVTAGGEPDCETDKHPCRDSRRSSGRGDCKAAKKVSWEEQAQRSFTDI